MSKERNIEALLALGRPGTKVVVGDGPYRERLRPDLPIVVILGSRTGAAYRVVGAIDIVTESNVGCLDDDLQPAIETALRDGAPQTCLSHDPPFHLGALHGPVAGRIRPIPAGGQAVTPGDQGLTCTVDWSWPKCQKRAACLPDYARHRPC